MQSLRKQLWLVGARNVVAGSIIYTLLINIFRRSFSRNKNLKALEWREKNVYTSNMWGTSLFRRIRVPAALFECISLSSRRGGSKAFYISSVFKHLSRARHHSRLKMRSKIFLLIVILAAFKELSHLKEWLKLELRLWRLLRRNG